MKEEHSIFTDWTAEEKKRLGLENLFHKCFPGDTYNGNIILIFMCNNIKLSAHRAMEDARAMKRIFPSNLLYPVLSNLSIRSKSDIVGHWQTLNHERVTSQQFIIHLGTSCTKMMAKRLNEHNTTIDVLKFIFEQSFDDCQSFNNKLQMTEVKRKGWSDKIWNHFTGRKPT